MIKEQSFAVRFLNMILKNMALEVIKKVHKWRNNKFLINVLDLASVNFFSSVDILFFRQSGIYVVCNAPENSKTERGGLNFVDPEK